jgi:hypothetical protein
VNQRNHQAEHAADLDTAPLKASEALAMMQALPEHRQIAGYDALAPNKPLHNQLTALMVRKELAIIEAGQLVLKQDAPVVAAQLKAMPEKYRALVELAGQEVAQDLLTGRVRHKAAGTQRNLVTRKHAALDRAVNALGDGYGLAVAERAIDGALWAALGVRLKAGGAASEETAATYVDAALAAGITLDELRQALAAREAGTAELADNDGGQLGGTIKSYQTELDRVADWIVQGQGSARTKQAHTSVIDEAIRELSNPSKEHRR